MSVLVVLVACGCLGVFDCGQPDKSLLINVNPERIDTCQRHVYTEVKFVTIEEQRVIDVLADYRALFEITDFLKVVRDENAFALRA